MTELMLDRGTGRRALGEIEVAEAMHPGVLTCPLETPLRDVARMMALYRIHAVVAFGEDTDDANGVGLGASSPIWTSCRPPWAASSRTAVQAARPSPRC